MHSPACARARADLFYVWVEDRPMPPWQIALAILMAVMIFAVCLFPLAPANLRSVVVYFFLGLLCSIFALILVRFLIFLVVFAFIGAKSDHVIAVVSLHNVHSTA
jgi:uncharacterized membrane protein YjjP (DUF1212 family)